MSPEPARAITSQVLVLGNLAFETVLIPERASDREAFRKHTGWVGAIIIKEMISQALGCGENVPTAASPPVRIHPVGLVPDDLKGKCEELTTILGQFPRRSDGKKSDTVWRVKENYRAWPDGDSLTIYGPYLEKCIRACPDPDIVVIYEQDPQFRKAIRELAEKPHETQAKESDRRSTSTLICG